MPTEDDITYGFNREQALELVNGIGQRDFNVRLYEESNSSSSGMRLYRFTLNEAWSSGAADADILQMDGTDTGIDADVLDPLGIFSTLSNGDAGLCLLQDGSYYVIQAPCPT
jgi:hypothetical protein